MPFLQRTKRLQEFMASIGTAGPSSTRNGTPRRGSQVACAAAAAPAEEAATRPNGSQHRGGGGGGAGAEDWQQEVLAALSQAEGFAELTIRAKVASVQPWHTITVRPISLRGARHLQVTTFTARQSASTNHPAAPGDAVATAATVRPLLAAAGLGSVTLRTSQQDLAVQITKRGKGILHRSAPQSRPALVSLDPGRSLAHDRTKDTPIPGDQPHPFLQKIGFQTADGRVRANMQDKFSQVNEFLKLLGHTGLIKELLAARPGDQDQDTTPDSPASPWPSSSSSASSSPSSSSPASSSAPPSRTAAPPASSPRQPLHILDCGCGSSHLSFGTYHYLNHVLRLPATLGGVDVNAQLMKRSNENAEQLGLEGVHFDTAPIGDYRPPVRPDIVLALHACDTATDDALALAVKQASPLIMAVPCCHAHLHKQLAGQPPSSRPPWAPLLRHGIMRQRQLDLVTDALRAQLLRVAGYRTDVVEFVSTEHTPRNLLIRAVRQHREQQPRPQEAPSGASGGGGSPVAASAAPSWRPQQLVSAQEYLQLRDYWGVTPRLEVLLDQELGPLLVAAAGLEAAEEEKEEEVSSDDDSESS